MKNIHYIVVFLAITSLLGSCGIYSGYSRPDLKTVTDSLYRDAAAGTDTVTIASKPWRELFSDPYLQTLIATGLERSTDLSVARLQSEEAQAVLMNARLSYLPSVSLVPQAGISRYNGDTKKTYNFGVAASWEIDIFGKVTNAKRGAAAAVEQSRAYEQVVRTQLVATIVESYYTLLMLDEQLAISDKTLANWDETIATLEALVHAGRSDDVAVRQARAGRTALDASRLTIRKSIIETENSLCALLKEPAHRIGRGTLADQSFPEELVSGLPLLLLSNRPDVRQAEAALVEAFYATNSARAAFYPSLTLSGSTGWTNSGGGSILNPGKWLSSAIASLTAPLFDKGMNIANLAVAKARQEEAVLRFEQSLFDAGNEVNDALAEWQTADERIVLDKFQIADLESAVDKLQLLVRYTSSNYLEVLAAQQSLLGARLILAEDRIAKIQAVVRLYHALGGGVE
ncbi:MAG: TolC family protein [Bacteroidales bacterium]|nr:TolC family protein [Bacteroidales bacterium]MCM1146352.1 TolC family protein [Bacteroidales bacterium]MCM1205210.1 TolC family protein [Bacillota bacterium]MCM1509705.1 TolC family protein [Clostridium sp.]